MCNKKPTGKNFPFVKSQRGFSLIEVMVSVMVLAVGLIGAVGLQVFAFRTTQQSTFQTVALELAADMAEKMRANTSEMKQSDGNNAYLISDYSALDQNLKAPSKLCISESVDCNAQELAAFDIYEWKKRLKTALPSGRAVICRDAKAWDVNTKAFTWTCDASTSENASLVIKIGWQGKNPDGSLIRDANKQFPPSVALTVMPYIK
jgi:type IV pilus assembly protein PilV